MVWYTMYWIKLRSSTFLITLEKRPKINFSQLYLHFSHELHTIETTWFQLHECMKWLPLGSVTRRTHWRSKSTDWEANMTANTNHTGQVEKRNMLNSD